MRDSLDYQTIPSQPNPIVYKYNNIILYIWQVFSYVFFLNKPLHFYIYTYTPPPSPFLQPCLLCSRLAISLSTLSLSNFYQRHHANACIKAICGFDVCMYIHKITYQLYYSSPLNFNVQGNQDTMITQSRANRLPAKYNTTNKFSL